MELRTLEQLRTMAVNGDGQACFELYQEYKNGIHVDENQNLAQDWLEKAVDCNNASAQLVMGLSLLSKGELKDAEAYLELAVNNGSIEAMHIAGQLYLGNIEGVSAEDTDIRKGLALLREAARKGSVHAQIMLGKCYYTGKWLHKNNLLATWYLEMAKNQGSDEAGELLDEACRIATDLN